VNQNGVGKQSTDGRTLVDLSVDPPTTGAPAASGSVTFEVNSNAFANFTYGQALALPTQPDALRPVLAAEVKPFSDVGMVVEILDLLSMPVTPPDVRAGLFGLLATYDFRSVGDRLDQDQRNGAGFEATVDQTLVTAVFVSGTAVPLGVAVVVAPHPATSTSAPSTVAPGTVLQYVVYVDGKVTSQGPPP